MISSAKALAAPSSFCTRQAHDGRLGVGDWNGRVDFALAFAVVHEVPDAGAFFGEVRAALKPGGRALVSEPVAHVTEAGFARTLDAARESGFAVLETPAIPLSRSALIG